MKLPFAIGRGQIKNNFQRGNHIFKPIKHYLFLLFFKRLEGLG